MPKIKIMRTTETTYSAVMEWQQDKTNINNMPNNKASAFKANPLIAINETELN